LGREHDGSEDEEKSSCSVENARRLSYANIIIDGSKQEVDLVRPPEQPDASLGGEPRRGNTWKFEMRILGRAGRLILAARSSVGRERISWRKDRG